MCPLWIWFFVCFQSEKERRNKSLKKNRNGAQNRRHNLSFCTHSSQSECCCLTFSFLRVEYHVACVARLPVHALIYCRTKYHKITMRYHSIHFVAYNVQCFIITIIIIGCTVKWMLRTTLCETQNTKQLLLNEWTLLWICFFEERNENRRKDKRKNMKRNENILRLKQPAINLWIRW